MWGAVPGEEGREVEKGGVLGVEEVVQMVYKSHRGILVVVKLASLGHRRPFFFSKRGDIMPRMARSGRHCSPSQIWMGQLQPELVMPPHKAARPDP